LTEITPVLSGQDVLKATNGHLLKGDADLVYRGISTDTRTLQAGNLFVALKGETFDGHDFVDLAMERGAAGMLVQNRTVKPVSGPAAIILVEDTLAALGNLAHYWRNGFSVPVVAITGSSGKTTTKEMLAGIVGQTKNILKTEGNLNNLIGLPMTLFKLAGHHDCAILEMGTNRRGEIARLTRIARPDVGLITNIGLAHLEGLNSLDTIREEKGDLFYYMGSEGTAVINVDDENVKMASSHWRGQHVTFGMKDPADVMARNIRSMSSGGVSFQLMIGTTMHDVSMNIAGLHHVYNALAAAATATALGMDGASIVAGLAGFRPVPGRMDVRTLANGVSVIDDTYNANPASVAEALKALKDLRGAGRSIAVLGDMLELGNQSQLLHESIGEIAARSGLDRLLLKGDFASFTAAGAAREGMPADAVRYFRDDGEAVDFLKSYLHDGDWVLVKGSRRMKMEQIVQRATAAFGLKQKSSEE
jgi:UDP-N-acetylmuramoyl-tripeptide--D-alanyl-D-alanine ligase